MGFSFFRFKIQVNFNKRLFEKKLAFFFEVSYNEITTKTQGGIYGKNS